MSLNDTLEKNYSLLKEESKQGKSNLLYCNLQIKKARVDLSNFNQSIYQDIKLFIKFYIESLEERDYGYDSFNPVKVVNAICLAPSYGEKYELSRYAYRQLIKHELEEEANFFNKLSLDYKTKFFCHNKQYFRYILNLTTHNLFAIFITIAIILGFNILILQPAPHANIEILKYSPIEYSKYRVINDGINVLAHLFSIDDKIEIKPISPCGVILLVSLKVIYISIIANFLYKKIIEKFK